MAAPDYFEIADEVLGYLKEPLEALESLSKEAETLREAGKAVDDVSAFFEAFRGVGYATAVLGVAAYALGIGLLCVSMARRAPAWTATPSSSVLLRTLPGRSVGSGSLGEELPPKQPVQASENTSVLQTTGTVREKRVGDLDIRLMGRPPKSSRPEARSICRRM